MRWLAIVALEKVAPIPLHLFNSISSYFMLFVLARFGLLKINTTTNN